MGGTPSSQEAYSAEFEHCAPPKLVELRSLHILEVDLTTATADMSPGALLQRLEAARRTEDLRRHGCLNTTMAATADITLCVLVSASTRLLPATVPRPADPDPTLGTLIDTVRVAVRGPAAPSLMTVWHWMGRLPRLQRAELDLTGTRVTTDAVVGHPTTHGTSILPESDMLRNLCVNLTDGAWARPNDLVVFLAYLVATLSRPHKWMPLSVVVIARGLTFDETQEGAPDWGCALGRSVVPMLEAVGPSSRLHLVVDPGVTEEHFSQTRFHRSLEDVETSVETEGLCRFEVVRIVE